MELYFKNTKTGTRFKVIRMDKEKGTVVLEGEYGQFEDKFDKDWLVKNGYVLEKVGADNV